MEKDGDSISSEADGKVQRRRRNDGQDLSNDIQVIRFEAKVRGRTDEGLNYTMARESQQALSICSLSAEGLEKT